MSKPYHSIMTRNPYHAASAMSRRKAKKNPAAVALGKRGAAARTKEQQQAFGKHWGTVYSASLTPEQRTARARHAGLSQASSKAKRQAPSPADTPLAASVEPAGAVPDTQHHQASPIPDDA